MDNSNKEMVIKLSCALSYMLKKFRIIIIGMLVCGIGFDVFKTLTYSPSYSSTITANFMNGEASTYESLESTVTYMTNMNYIFNSEGVKQYICEKLNLEETSMECTVTSMSGTNIGYITVTANTKREAFYALNYILDWYNSNKVEYSFNYNINVINESSISMSAINANNHKKNLTTGLTVGGIVLCAIFLLRNYFSTTIKTPKELENKVGTRLFAKLPKEKKKRGRKSGINITSLRTSFAYKEAIKRLRSKVEDSSAHHDYHTIMITGSLENEGKSSVALNLAIALAQNDHKVLLMDMDFRKPSLHLLFGLKDKQVGINDYLEGDMDWVAYVRKTNVEKLDVLFARKDIDKADTYISSHKLHYMIEEAKNGNKEKYDYIIIDTPPARYITDAAILNSYVDGTLLVVKQDLATVREINETIDRLKGSKDNLIGCVYNTSIKDFTQSGHKSAYGYGYGRKRGAK